MVIWCIWDHDDTYSYCINRYVAVCKPHRYRELNIRVGMIRRIMIYTIPVATISVLLNIPKFFETKVNSSAVFWYYFYTFYCLQIYLCFVIVCVTFLSNFNGRLVTAMKLGWYTTLRSCAWHRTIFGGIHWAFFFIRH